MRRRPRTAPARPPRRASLAWAALALILAQIAGFSHELLVAHVRCEHGELVHASAPGDPAHGVNEPVLGGREASIDAAAGDGDGHDHCRNKAVERRPPGTVRPDLAQVACLEVRLAPAALPSGRPPIDLLDLAPKSSPPTRA